MNAYKIDIGNTDPDVIFSSEEERREAAMPKVQQIPINRIDSFKDHPFHVRNDEDMQQLIDSVSAIGVRDPAIVRAKDNGRFEMISGHRRKYASGMAGLEMLPCIVQELTDDEATILMADSNIHRTNILPSEKAFSYRMKLEAMSRQGQRTDLTSSPLGTKFRSDVLLANQTGESRNQIQRYIRLTELIPELLLLVDDNKIKFRPAVDLSYLDKDLQGDLLEVMQETGKRPSLEQATQMKNAAKNGTLDRGGIMQLLQTRKKSPSPAATPQPPPQPTGLTLTRNDGLDLLPKDMGVEEQEDFIVEAIKHYVKKDVGSSGGDTAPLAPPPENPAQQPPGFMITSDTALALFPSGMNDEEKEEFVVDAVSFYIANPVEPPHPQPPGLVLSKSDILDLIPGDISIEEQEDFVAEALKIYVECLAVEAEQDNAGTES